MPPFFMGKSDGILLRLWLSLPDDRTLSPVFAERYGSVEVGNRGGILVEGTRLVAPLSP